MMEVNLYKNITIIIVSFLSDHIIEGCLKKINKRYKVILIENSNRKKLKKKIEKKFYNVECHLMGYDAGYPSAANYGINLATTKYILLINPDTFLEKNCIRNLYQFMEKNKNVPIAFPLTIRKNNKPSVDCGFFNNNLKPDLTKKIVRIDYSNGNAIFFKKKNFKKKFFDDNIFLQFDDTDLCWRLKKAKKKIYIITDARVKHLEGKSHMTKFDYELKKEVWWHNGWSQIYIAKKHFNIFNFIKISFKKIIISFFKSIILLFLLRKKQSNLYLLNCIGSLSSLFNLKSFYRAKIDI